VSGFPCRRQSGGRSPKWILNARPARPRWRRDRPRGSHRAVSALIDCPEQIGVEHLDRAIALIGHDLGRAGLKRLHACAARAGAADTSPQAQRRPSPNQRLITTSLAQRSDRRAAQSAGVATIERCRLLVDPRGLLVRRSFAVIQLCVLLVALGGLAGFLPSRAGVLARSRSAVLRASRELLERRRVIRGFAHGSIVNIVHRGHIRGFYDRRSRPVRTLAGTAGRGPRCVGMGRP